MQHILSQAAVAPMPAFPTSDIAVVTNPQRAATLFLSSCNGRREQPQRYLVTERGALKPEEDSREVHLGIERHGGGFLSGFEEGMLQE